MLLSIALILLAGMFTGWLCTRLHLPSLLGMILTGILLGPFVLNLLDPTILTISPDLRKIALIIILTRAGLTLDLGDLIQVGRPAILLCFVPACFEIGGIVLLAPKLLGISVLDAAILGAVLGAVSPAVIVPRMIRLIEQGVATDKGIPQMILAGASVDDVFVIVMFTAFTGLAQGESVSAAQFLHIPVSIALGAALGWAVGFGMAKFFEHFHMRDTVKVMIFLSLSFLLVTAEDAGAPFSGLIAVMASGIALQRQRPKVAVRLSSKFNKLWATAEILLFVLVGATVDPSYAMAAGPKAVLLILLALVVRSVGVQVCLLGAHLTLKERLFCAVSYLPKATVQAAIGGVPLAMGLGCGKLVLTVAVLAILITAPLGAFLMDIGADRMIKAELARRKLDPSAGMPMEDD